MIPTLTTDGIVKEPSMLLRKIFEYFLTSDYSQTNMYRDSISSLKYVIYETIGQDALTITQSVSDVLKKILLRYYVNADVKVRLSDDIKSLYISAQVTHSNGKQYKLEDSAKLDTTIDDTYFKTIAIESDF